MIGVLLLVPALRGASTTGPNLVFLVLLAIALLELTLGVSAGMQLDMTKAVAIVRAVVWAALGVLAFITGGAGGSDLAKTLVGTAIFLVSAGAGLLLLRRRAAWITVIAVLLTLAPGLVVALGARVLLSRGF